jgi:hypothetical protein
LKLRASPQVFFLKILIIAKLHSNKTTPNGLGLLSPEDISRLDALDILQNNDIA